MDANTPVSKPAIVVELPVKILNGRLLRLANANDHVVGIVFCDLVLTVNTVVTDPIVIVPVTVSLNPVLVIKLIWRVSPLLTMPVVPATCPLIIRYHEVVIGSKLNVTGTAIFITPAV